LDGELARIKEARGMGLVPPDFLLDAAISQMEQSIAETSGGGTMVDSLVTRTKEAGLAGDWEAQARSLVTGPVTEALKRQLEELKAERAVAKPEAGMWARPQGEEWYAWGLQAATTTTLSPDEIHQIGLDELDELHGRMDPILKEIGYTTGSAGERMRALAQDPR